MKTLYKPLSTLFLLCCLFTEDGYAQIIHLFAGNHTSGYTGNGGPATAAECFAPAGIASDTAGNIYISDLGNSAIRKVTADGVIHTIAGTGVGGFGGDGGPATAAQVDQPTSICTDLHGNIYFTDENNNRVRKIDVSGNINTIAGNGFAGYGGDGFLAINAELNAPSGVAVDRIGNIYIADANNHVVRKVDTAGIITLFAGTGSPGYGGDGGFAGGASLNFPRGVAVDTSGNVYIVDQANSMIRKVFTNGRISRYAGDTTASGAPSFGYGGDGGYSTSAMLNSPTEVALGPDGTMYIADYNNHRIRKVKSNGEISTIAGNGTSGYSGNGGSATAAELAGPYGVAVDKNGKVYLTDEINNVAQVRDAASAVNDVYAANELHVYPNPSSGSFTVDLPQALSDAVISITDIVGNTIETKNVDNTASQQVSFTLSGIPAGTYILSVQTPSITYKQKIAVW